VATDPPLEPTFAADAEPDAPGAGEARADDARVDAARVDANQSDERGADATVLPPPKALLAILFASLFGCVLTAGYAYRYTVMWQRERAGESIAEQRKTMQANVPVFKDAFVSVTQQIREILPPGTKVFYQPTRMGNEDDQRARWFLFLTYYLHPIQVYVRKPDLAAGTLVTYPGWNAYHRDPRTKGIQEHEGHALVELGIEWKLRMPHETSFFGAEVYLEKLIDGNWVPWDIWTNRPMSERRGN